MQTGRGFSWPVGGGGGGGCWYGRDNRGRRKGSGEGMAGEYMNWIAGSGEGGRWVGRVVTGAAEVRRRGLGWMV